MGFSAYELVVACRLAYRLHNNVDMAKDIMRKIRSNLPDVYEAVLMHVQGYDAVAHTLYDVWVFASYPKGN